MPPCDEVGLECNTGVVRTPTADLTATSTASWGLGVMIVERCAVRRCLKSPVIYLVEVRLSRGWVSPLPRWMTHWRQPRKNPAKRTQKIRLPVWNR